jgi:hypothetical protein
VADTKVMPTSFLRAAVKSGLVVAALVLIPSGSLWAQENAFTAALKTTSPMPAPAAVQPVAFVAVPQEKPQPHRFWDNENRVLFASVTGLAAADFFVTRANLASGGRELNPVTRVFGRSSAGLAANFTLETGSILGASYLFHRTGHHRLERLTSGANVAASGAAVGYGLTHR